MGRRTILLTLLSVSGFLVLGNLLLVPWSHRLPYRQKLEDIRRSSSPDVLFLGNSLLDGRVNPEALERGADTKHASFAPLNAALGGSDPHVHALLLEYALRSHPELRTLVIGFFDFQLTDEGRATPANLTGNDSVALDTRFPLSEVDAVYHFGLLQAAEVRFLRAVPMIAYRENAWKYVELLRRRMAAMGLPAEATNRNGRVADFSALEAGTPERFDFLADRYLRDPSHLDASYERILGEAAQHRMRVVLVVMPISPQHRQMYYDRPLWHVYLDTVSADLGRRGFSVIDASGWLTQPGDFADNLHMTPEAASTFSYELGKKLAETAPQSN